MIMSKISFDKCFEDLKNTLMIEPILKTGNEAEEIMRKYGSDKFTNGAYIYYDNLNIVAVRDTSKLGILAHEMRHAYQYKWENEKYRWEEGNNRPKEKTINKFKRKIYYLVCNKELDANKFAYKYCKKNKINGQILNCFFNVLVTYLFRTIVPVYIILLSVIFYVN